MLAQMPRVPESISPADASAMKKYSAYLNCLRFYEIKSVMAKQIIIKR